MRDVRYNMFMKTNGTNVSDEIEPPSFQMFRFRAGDRARP